MAINKKLLEEDLKNFKSILEYDYGTTSTRRRRMTEADPEEENPTEDEDVNTDETNQDDMGDNPDFDFGDATSDTEEIDTTEIPDETPKTDFGNEDQFSAADEIVDDESDVEEIDVTDIVSKSEEAKEYAQQALAATTKNSEFLQGLTDKLDNLEQQLNQMDLIAQKITRLEQDIKTPEEKLELRSLDSYPFNTKLSDYWQDKANKDKNYRISSGESEVDGEKREYVITPEDVSEYSKTDIKTSFIPQGK